MDIVRFTLVFLFIYLFFAESSQKKLFSKVVVKDMLFKNIYLHSLNLLNFVYMNMLFCVVAAPD